MRRMNIKNSLFKTTVKRIFKYFNLNISWIKNAPEITLLGLVQRPIKTVIDIGANTGQFARYISTIFPDVIIYSFEPLPSEFIILKNWALRQRGRVIAINSALGSQTENIIMNLHVDHAVSSSILKTSQVAETLYPMTNKQKEIVVHQTTLDKALCLDDIDGDVLIKMDVQGYEDRVLAGGKKIFSHAYACIIEIALDQLYKKQASFENILMSMNQMGYRYAGNIQQVYGQDGHCVYLDALFVRRDPHKDISDK